MDHTSCVLGVVKLSTKVAKKIKGKKEEEAQSKTMQLKVKQNSVKMQQGKSFYSHKNCHTNNRAQS